MIFNDMDNGVVILSFVLAVDGVVDVGLDTAGMHIPQLGR